MSEKNPWTTLSSSVVYDNPWIQVTEFQVLNPAGRPAVYGKVSYKNTALAVIPVSADGQTWLVGQFRFPLDLYSWEIPEGGGRLGVDPLNEAKRELKEETGLEARHWRKLMDLHLSNSTTDEHGIVYLATGLTEGESEPEESEQLKVQKVALKDAFVMAADGRITDVLTVTALLKVELMIAKGELRFGGPG